MVRESPGLILNFLGTSQKSWAEMVKDARKRKKIINVTMKIFFNFALLSSNFGSQTDKAKSIIPKNTKATGNPLQSFLC
jgi:hypothetical protein